jgi:type I restriction enzyme S subunit
LAKWPKVKLTNHVNLLAGFAFKSQHFTEKPTDIPLVKGENVSQGCILWGISKRWPATDWSKMEKFQLRPGDVVVAMDRPWIPAGLKWAYIREGDPRALLVQRCARLRTNDDGLDQRFLRFVIGAPGFEDYVKPITTGVNVPHISGQQILDYEFALPPLPVQRRIAAVLSAFDELIENSERRVRILETMARAVYREWFVHFRFPGHENHSRVASPLGEIPSGWEVRKLGDLLTLDKGVSYSGAGLTGDGNPMVNLKNIHAGGGFRRDATKPYSGKFKPQHTVKAGDVVVANTDLTQAGNVVASPALIPSFGEDKPILISHHLYAVRPTHGVPPRFVFHLMLTEDFRGFAKGFASGTTVLGLPKEGILNYPFACPPLALINHFVARVAAIHELMDGLHKRIENLRRGRDLLLPRLLSGQVEIHSA